MQDRHGKLRSLHQPDDHRCVADGSHSFAVRAVDSGGHVDPSPATRSFSVRTSTAPLLPPPPPPASGIPTNWNRSASFETDLSSGVDAWRIDSPFVVTRTSEAGAADGSYAAKIVTNGGGGSCSCPRMKYENGFSYGPGTSVWISGSWKILEPDKVAWSRLMNLGHYEGVTGKD
jgi:hypothetical protein